MTTAADLPPRLACCAVPVPGRLPLEDLSHRLFGAADSVCLERARLVTDIWPRLEHLPRPILRARVFEHVLAHMTLDLDTNPVFAGNTSTALRAWMLLPEFGFFDGGQMVIEHDDLRDFLEDKVPATLREFWRGKSSADQGVCGDGGPGHLAVDLDAVVQHGVAELLAQVAARRDDPRTGADERVYLEAMHISLRALVAWAHRYADAANAAARTSPDAQTAACHRRVAVACRHVPEHPARNLFEGLQAIVLVHLALAIEGQSISVSIGLPDRALAAFAPQARADADAAADLVAAFLLKIAANSINGKGSKTQAVTVGGADHTGADRCNAVTLAFLDGFDRVAVSDPHLFLRWHDSIDVAVRQRAVHMLSRGRSMPLLVTDVPTAQGFIDSGVDPADAWEYCIIGCNELGIPGRCFDSAICLQAGYNDLALLNRLLLETPADQLDALADLPALLRQLESVYTAHFRKVLPGRDRVKQRIAQLMPAPLTTALMRGGAERARDYMLAMPYTTPCIYTRGLSNAVNALAAIEVLVFEKHLCTLAALADALRADLSDASLREQLMRTPKWGNDDPRANELAVILVDLRRRAVERIERELKLPRHVVCHVVRSLHHVDGRRIAASLDGRTAGSPVGDSIGALCGTASNGPTATLASVLTLCAARDFAGGYNLNLNLTPNQADPAVVDALVEGFCRDGGQELQINVLDAGKLLDAREHPERYRDLVVRVAGLSARFIELSDAEQLELIARAQAAGG